MAEPLPPEPPFPRAAGAPPRKVRPACGPLAAPAGPGRSPGAPGTAREGAGVERGAESKAEPGFRGLPPVLPLALVVIYSSCAYHLFAITFWHIDPGIHRMLSFRRSTVR